MALCSQESRGHAHPAARPVLDISEIFTSIQGEGKDCGVYALFFRLAKCNLACTFCDSKHSWPPGRPVPEEEIIRWMEEFLDSSGNNYVVWTGGEPLLQYDRLEAILTNPRIKGRFYNHLETNGTIIPAKPFLWNSIAVSPKSSKSFDPRWLDIKNAVIKLVVTNIEQAIRFQRKHSVPSPRFYVMARSDPRVVGYSGERQLITEAALARGCIKQGFNFSPRLQALYEWGIGQ